MYVVETKKKKLPKQTRTDAIYTGHQRLILKVNNEASIREIIRTASALCIDMSYLDLSGMIAYKLRFYYQHAPFSKFTDGNYQYSRFGKSMFQESDFSDSDLYGCGFMGSIFSESKFTNCNMQYCDFRNSFFNEVDFSGSDLRGCDFTGCVLGNSIFHYADLRGAKLDGADITQCEFDFANITVKEKLDILKLN